jgi:putative ABC transport system permease protein
MLYHAVVLARLPFAEPERVWFLDERNDARGLAQFSVSAPNYLSWQAGARSFSHMAAFYRADANLGADRAHAAERAVVFHAASSLWATLGIAPLRGRTFDAAEERSAAPVALISERLWRQRYGADPEVIGRNIAVDGQSRQVLGVVPDDHGFATDAELWLPLLRDASADNRDDRRWNVVARLAPGVAQPAAAAELDALAVALEREFPDSNTGWRVRMTDARAWIVGADASSRLVLTLTAVFVLLLVACLNIANLQLARASTRLGEYSVRQALGASRARVLLEAMSESAVVAIFGAMTGVVLGHQLLRVGIAWLPASTPRLSTVSFDPLIALGIALVATLVSLVFALAPALLVARGAPARLLGHAARGALSGSSSRLRRVLVVAQFALATVLLLTAAVLARQFQALNRLDAGFASTRVLTAQIALKSVEDEASLNTQRALLERIAQAARALPGVQSAGWTSQIPLGSLNTSMEVWGASANYRPGDPGVQASWRIISSDYLDVLNVPVLAGRRFGADEPAHSALLSAALATALWPQAEAVGREIVLGNNQRFTVVGVVGDVRQIELKQDYTPTVYLPTTWYLWPSMALTVRTQGDPRALLAPLREASLKVAPEHPLFDLGTLDSAVAATVAEPRLQTWLFTAFALASGLLAALGVAGVTAFGVTQRTPELAMRMALGASAREIRRHVLRGGAVLCALGIALGLIPAWLAAQSLRSAILALPDTPWVLVPAAAAMLCAIGLIACWLPARRAARIEPSQALRGA